MSLGRICCSPGFLLWRLNHQISELLKLGIKISESSIAKYMVRQPKPPSPTWRTFLKNHAKQLVSVDFFIVPTALFQVLSLDKNSPDPRPVQSVGKIVAISEVGGLHHRYERRAA